MEMTSAELLTRFLLQRPAPAHRLSTGRAQTCRRADPPGGAPRGLHLLLTRRSAALRHHPGQISFPGGRQDPEDRDLIHTALRNRGGAAFPLPDPDHRQPHPLNTVSLYDVLPVLAMLDPGYRLTLSRDEVAQAFEVPLAHVLDPGQHIA
jgi:hypothetical protein